MEFKFDILILLKKEKTEAQKHVDGVTIRLPFLSFSVKPSDIEKSIARELLIRLTDKRVLSSKECCDDCIDYSLASLQEIRKVLVESQIKLSSYHSDALYLLIEIMAEGVRQFITFEESIKIDTLLRNDSIVKSLYRPQDIRQKYFSALEKLRFHIHSCLSQIALLADMETPKLESYLRSQDEWDFKIYKNLESLQDC